MVIRSAKSTVDSMTRNLEALIGADVNNWKEYVDELIELSIAFVLLGNIKNGHEAIEALLDHYHKVGIAAEDGGAAVENAGRKKEDGYE